MIVMMSSYLRQYYSSFVPFDRTFDLKKYSQDKLYFGQGLGYVGFTLKPLSHLPGYTHDLALESVRYY